MARFTNTPEGRVEWVHHLIRLARDFNCPEYPEGQPPIVRRSLMDWIYSDFRRPGCEDVTVEWITSVADEFFKNEKINCDKENSYNLSIQDL